MKEFKEREEVEFLLHGDWIKGSIRAYIISKYNNTILGYLIWSNGKEYNRQKSAIRKITK